MGTLYRWPSDDLNSFLRDLPKLPRAARGAALRFLDSRDPQMARASGFWHSSVACGHNSSMALTTRSWLTPSSG
jgi:hypothetical protein